MLRCIKCGDRAESFYRVVGSASVLESNGLCRHCFLSNYMEIKEAYNQNVAAEDAYREWLEEEADRDYTNTV